jgi:flagellar hook-basal body complex protein FliE
LSISTLSTNLGVQVGGSQLLGSADTAGGAASAGSGPSFGDTLQNAFENVNALQNNAAGAATQFALGQSSDIHSVMIAGQKAGIALELTTEVRNKVVDAYQSIMSISM